jgi:hypothetical protein
MQHYRNGPLAHKGMDSSAEAAIMLVQNSLRRSHLWQRWIASAGRSFMEQAADCLNGNLRGALEAP